MKTIFGGKTGLFLLLLVVLLLAGLPVAVWLDLSNLTENNLKRQASDLNSIIGSVRRYFHSGDAVARARQSDQRATAQHHLPLRFRLSVRQPRAARARCVRDLRACAVARKSQP